MTDFSIKRIIITVGGGKRCRACDMIEINKHLSGKYTPVPLSERTEHEATEILYGARTDTTGWQR